MTLGSELPCGFFFPFCFEGKVKKNTTSSRPDEALFFSFFLLTFPVICSKRVGTILYQMIVLSGAGEVGPIPSVPGAERGAGPGSVPTAPGTPRAAQDYKSRHARGPARTGSIRVRPLLRATRRHYGAAAAEPGPVRRRAAGGCRGGADPSGGSSAGPRGAP